MDTEKKTTQPKDETQWSNNILFYGGEALVILAGSYYIISDQIEKHNLITMPFAIGLLLLDLVAVVAMHWALTKLTTRLIAVSYLVWLPLTALVLFSAGLIWMANSRTEAHQAQLEEARKAREQQAEIDRRAASEQQQAELGKGLTVMQQAEQMARNAKTATEKREIYRMAQQIVKAEPTPQSVQSLVSAVTPKHIDQQQVEGWQPFVKDSFFEFWYQTGVRFLGLFGLCGLAVLLGFYLQTREAEEAEALARSRQRVFGNPN